MALAVAPLTLADLNASQAALLAGFTALAAAGESRDNLAKALDAFSASQTTTATTLATVNASLAAITGTLDALTVSQAATTASQAATATSLAATLADLAASQAAATASQAATATSLAATLADLAASQAAATASQAATATSLAALAASQAAATASLAQISAALSNGADEASAATPAGYEERGRRLLRAQLERRCGLRILDGAALQRLEGGAIDADGRSVEWDFCASAAVSSAPPSAAAEDASFAIYYTHAAYIRPLRPQQPRHLTPSKAPGELHPIACDFMAVFEITTSSNWAKLLLIRLEERLRVSLQRACAMDGASADGGGGSGGGSSDGKGSSSASDRKALGILDVVAVIGVVSPFSCRRGVAARLAADGALVLLREMAQAGRFVCLVLEDEAQ